MPSSDADAVMAPVELDQLAACGTQVGIPTRSLRHPWEPRHPRSSLFVSRYESDIGRRHPTDAIIPQIVVGIDAPALLPPEDADARAGDADRSPQPCRRRGQDALANAGGCPALERSRHGDGVLEPYLAVARRLSR
jgi:hypothetical protein